MHDQKNALCSYPVCNLSSVVSEIRNRLFLSKLSWTCRRQAMFLFHILAVNALISEANVPASNGGGQLFYESALPLYSQSPGNAPKEQGEGATYTPLIEFRLYGLRLCTIITQARCVMTKFDLRHAQNNRNRSISAVEIWYPHSLPSEKTSCVVCPNI